MKTVLLTGARGGIGTAISTLLKQCGHNVIEVDRRDADLASFEDIAKLKERVLSETSNIEWVVCAHGFIDAETVLEKQTPENIAATFDINTLSIAYFAHEFLPHIPKGGGIIALSSSAGLQANGRFATYSASKAAVNSFVQGLARNRPDQKFFAICPGPTNTEMRERVAGDAAKMQSPKVVAEVVATLVENAAEYASGDLILIKDSVVSIAGRV